MTGRWKEHLLDKCKISYGSNQIAASLESEFDRKELQKIDEREQLLQNLKQAKKEWVQAQNLFDHAIEPELIDYGIVMLESAEKKYNYFIKLARKLGIQVEI
ncbi:YaaL family protein [Fodinisporobacter ferrooxydans]|uniref:YaaL family protein n=1 Tax=Fodinisporobacter ferrooxydans TaxID=2901836 RepID=A0ABY4CMS0_9BACL|nr:YaaL family protein [Alicyclobacillaceae bacterium MYW30-H2]